MVKLEFVFWIALLEHVLKKQSVHSPLVHGHSSWSTFGLHLVRGPKGFCKLIFKETRPWMLDHQFHGPWCKPALIYMYVGVIWFVFPCSPTSPNISTWWNLCCNSKFAKNTNKNQIENGKSFFVELWLLELFVCWILY